MTQLDERGQDGRPDRDEGARLDRRTRYERRLASQLTLLYRPEVVRRLTKELLDLAPSRAHGEAAARNDCMLIVYADTIVTEGEPPLVTLGRFLDNHIGDAFGRLHVLPFFPSSSDDGFAVIDYRRVDHRLGGWEDVRRLSERYDIMFDLVINHCSRESLWFVDFIGGRDPGRNYFITLPEESDTSAVVRPRTTPLVSAVHTYGGIRHVWNTFSEDQIDLDFTNPEVLREFVDILFFYVARGARLIRLDAVAFLWKRLGTNCMSLPETHAVVRALRLLLEYARSRVRLITETNVPHAENLSYFGNGDEAHMIYQFSLSPLLLYSYVFGDSRHLTDWAARLARPRMVPPTSISLRPTTASGSGPWKGWFRKARSSGWWTGCTSAAASSPCARRLAGSRETSSGPTKSTLRHSPLLADGWRICRPTWRHTPCC